MTGSRLPSVLALAAVSIAVCTAPAAASATPVTTLTVGAPFNASGFTGSLPGKSGRATGVVVVLGRWGTGKWYVVTRTRTDAAGHYHFSLTPKQRGTLTLRIAPPDRHAQRFVLRVV